jgi:multidrug resistance efflux pump
MPRRAAICRAGRPTSAHVKAGQNLGVIETPGLDQKLEQAEADLAAAAARRLRRLPLDAGMPWSQQDTDQDNADAGAKMAELVATQVNVKR